MSRRLIVWTVFTFLVAVTASADCPVTLALGGIDPDGFLSATVTATGNCGFSSSVRITVDGDPAGQHPCNGQPVCAHTFRINTSCWGSTPRVIQGIGECKRLQPDNSCQTQSGHSPPQPKDVNNRPEPVTLSMTDVNDLWQSTATITAHFKTPANGRQYLRLVRNEDIHDVVAQKHYANGEQDVTWNPTVNLACQEGPQTFQAIAMTCGDHFGVSGGNPVPDDGSLIGRSAPKELSFDATPTATLTIPEPDATGHTTALVAGLFPHKLAGRRYLRLFRNGNINDVVKQERPDDARHDHSFPVPLACSSGTTTYQVAAMVCGDHFTVIGGNPVPSDPDFIGYSREESIPPKESTVKIALRTLGLDPSNKRIVEATLTYDLNAPSGTVQVDLRNWVDADGQVRPGGPLATYHVPPNPKTLTDVFTFTAPSGAQQVAVVATATTACGVVKASTFVNCDCPASGNPVYFTDGNMRLEDNETLPMLAGKTLSRTYNSHEQVAGLFGRGWTTLFDRRLIQHPDAVSLTTATNEVVTFQEKEGVLRQVWPESSRNSGTLSHDAVAGTYTYRAPGATEVTVFRASDGRLLTIRDAAAAREAVIGYDAQGRPATFTDTVTQVSWNLTFDGAARRVTSVAVAGRPDLIWNYSYDGSGNLLTVLAPGSAPWRTYEYVANRMTASYDALGNLIESHTYDADGFATSSTGDIDEISNIEYNLPGSVTNERITRVTYRTGSQAEYRFQPVGNEWRPVQVTGGCASCGSGDASYVHDKRGRTERAQSADGYITRTVYAGDHVLSVEQFLKPAGCDPQTDAQHCRLGTDALAIAVLEPSGATVKTTYEHADPLWPDKATAVIRPSVGAPGQLRGEDYVYDPVTGAVVSATICGWSTGSSACSERTTLTTFYEGGAAGLTPAFDPGGSFQSAWLALPQPARLPKSVDGPRADAQDVNSFVYYPIDPAVPALLRGRLAATRNAAGHITRYEDYDVFGNVTRGIDPNGVATEMTFDSLGRTATTTTKSVAGCNTTLDPLCATDLTTTQTYSPSSGPLQQQERPGGGVTSYTYDARGRMATVSRGPSAASLRERIETSYDPLTGKKSLERTLAFEGGAWVEKSRQSFAYDTQARLQTVTHADGAAIHYTYDAEDRIATVRDENHGAPNTAYAYDPAGRLAYVTQTLAGAPSGVIVTQYAYDIAGNLTSVTDPNGNITSYIYDDFGQMTSQSSPVTGTTTYGYDEAGNLTQTTDANGASTERTYDVANRVMTAVSARGEDTETVQWTYDSAAAGAFGLGRLATMEDPSGLTAYSYERRGLLREEARTILGNPFVQSYGYDANGNRTSIGYPSGRIVTYAFDDAGRPVTATGTIGGQNTSYVTSASYLPFRPMTSLTLGNGTTETRTYNSRYLPLTSSLTNGATTIAQYAYTNDPAGNITAIADATHAGYNRTFGYDDLNRLTIANTGSALWGSGSFTYDRMGNMLSATLGTAQRTFTHQGTTPRISTATGLATPMTYDAAGNELNSPAGDPGNDLTAASYSPRNQLRSQFVREYDRCVEEFGSACTQPDPVQEWRSNVYDGRGLRVMSTRNIISIGSLGGIEDPEPQADLYFYTPELTMLNIVTPTTSRTADVIWFGSRPVADHGEGDARYTFTDHLGTPILQTTSTATVVWRAEHEPFGNVYALRAGSTFDDQPLRFPGQQVAYRTAAGDENYNIFRWYRSGWGRYTQADPLNQIGLSIWNAVRKRLASKPIFVGETLMRPPTNDFVYVEADPIRRTDPMGLASQEWLCGMSSINPAPIPAPPLGKKLCLYDVYCFKLLDLMGWNPLTSIYVGAIGMTPPQHCSKCPSKCVFAYFGNHPAQEFSQSVFNAVCTK